MLVSDIHQHENIISLADSLRNHSTNLFMFLIRYLWLCQFFPVLCYYEQYQNEHTQTHKHTKTHPFVICKYMRPVSLCVNHSVMSDSLSPHGLSPAFVHEIFQGKILEWVATPFSRGSSQPEDQTWVSYFAGRFFTI